MSFAPPGSAADGASPSSEGFGSRDHSERPNRTYVEPPRPRSQTAQAMLWTAGYMRLFTPPDAAGRNVECCIPTYDDRTRCLAPCGTTLKHTPGTSASIMMYLITSRVKPSLTISCFGDFASPRQHTTRSCRQVNHYMLSILAYLL
eukprot:scaffold170307_cov49-Prasinocladus_malaysianus.AAC.2